MPISAVGIFVRIVSYLSYAVCYACTVILACEHYPALLSMSVLKQSTPSAILISMGFMIGVGEIHQVVEVLRFLIEIYN